MQVYTPVTVADEKHKRAGEVGVVVGADDPVEVKFEDGKVVAIPAKDLKGL